NIYVRLRLLFILIRTVSRSIETLGACRLSTHEIYQIVLVRQGRVAYPLRVRPFLCCSNLVSCAAVTTGGAHFVELGVRGGGGGGGAGAGEALRRPRVQCDGAALAAWLARHAAYARRLHTEAKHTLPPDLPD
ncbi:uncharacterized protein LOC133520977, partial [Cydia pomonella]|uniref:uncharacterized protein LOC133520977 n=1 Tax=Cydia pomonella TaxID=82600 RepID=UPI002ADE307C